MSNELVQPMSLSLYEIADEYVLLVEDIHEAAEENEGVIPDTLNDRFDKLAGTVTQKIENCGLVTQVQKHQIAAIKAEEERLRDLRKTAENQTARFKQYIADQMLRMEIRRSDGTRCKVWVQASPPSVEAVDESQIDDHFYDVHVTMRQKDFSKLLKMIPPSEEKNVLVESIDYRRTLNKNRVKEWWKSTHETAPEGTEVTRGYHLRVK